jgi:capsular polysaccharide biosynthesis protein
MRLAQWRNRQRSYEPMSLRNWVLRRLAWQVSKLRIKLGIRFETEVAKEKFVLFPLHVTPEATLLGSVPELADQFWMIKNLSMSLPAGVLLYVKEHPHQQIGLGLDYDFYRRVLSLPNVRLVSGRVGADSLYRHPNCVAVAVIAGTVGLEAALRRVPVFVFGKPIYHRGDCFIKPASFEEFFAAVMRILRGEYQFNEAALYAILQSLKDGLAEADVDLSSARSWLELGYLGNANTIRFIQGQYQEWAATRSAAGARSPVRHANAH